MLLVYKDFEWDLREAAACLTTHGVSFREASTVFADESVIISEDPTAGRLRAIGLSSRGRTLVVIHKRGHRISILGATPHTNGAPVGAPEPASAMPAAAVTTVAPELDAATPTEPAAIAEPPASGSRPSGTGWTAEAYGIYWDAYSAARDEARRQGKSPGEAQRIGREAGKRAMLGSAAPSPPKASAKAAARSGAPRAASRARKVR